MVIKRDVNTKINLKEAFIEDGKLIDVETGEAVNMTDLIEHVYGTNPVKIAISSSTTEEIE